MNDDLIPRQGRLPLSVLVDLLAGPTIRDERFVRRFCSWFHERAAHLHLVPLDVLGLVDVVVTFRMQQKVTLVVTGRHRQVPGAITIHFQEEDFPFIDVVVDRNAIEQPYEVCTLDYAVGGRPVVLTAPLNEKGHSWPAGAMAKAVLISTVGATHQLRVVFDTTPGRSVNLADGTYRFLDETCG